MCVVVFYDDNEIDTPAKFEQAFGFPPMQDSTGYDNDVCLCGYDLEATFEAKKIEFEYILGNDFFIISV